MLPWVQKVSGLALVAGDNHLQTASADVGPFPIFGKRFVFLKDAVAVGLCLVYQAGVGGWSYVCFLKTRNTNE